VQARKHSKTSWH